MALLAAIGCDVPQGYLIDRPPLTTARAVATWIAARFMRKRHIEPKGRYDRCL